MTKAEKDFLKALRKLVDKYLVYAEYSYFDQTHHLRGKDVDINLWDLERLMAEATKEKIK